MLANVDTFIIRIGFKLVNVDMTRTLTCKFGLAPPTKNVFARQFSPAHRNFRADWAAKFHAQKNRPILARPDFRLAQPPRPSSPGVRKIEASGRRKSLQEEEPYIEEKSLRLL